MEAITIMDEKPIVVVTRAHKATPEVGEILERYGCRIARFADRHEITFPVGTVCEPYPALTASRRHKLTLPTGLVVTRLLMPDRDYDNVLVHLDSCEKEPEKVKEAIESKYREIDERDKDER